MLAAGCSTGLATVLDLVQTADGVLLPIKAQPKARSNSIGGVHAGRLKVAVTEVPEKGKANAAICKLLAKSFGLRRNQVELVRGEASQQKTFLIQGHQVAQLLGLIQAAGVVRERS